MTAVRTLKAILLFFPGQAYSMVSDLDVPAGRLTALAEKGGLLNKTGGGSIAQYLGVED